MDHTAKKKESLGFFGNEHHNYMISPKISGRGLCPPHIHSNKKKYGKDPVPKKKLFLYGFFGTKVMYKICEGKLFVKISTAVVYFAYFAKRS